MTASDLDFERIEELINGGNHDSHYIQNEILFLIARILKEKL